MFVCLCVTHIVYNPYFYQITNFIISVIKLNRTVPATKYLEKGVTKEEHQVCVPLLFLEWFRVEPRLVLTSYVQYLDYVINNE